MWRSQDTVNNNWHEPWLCPCWKRTFLHRSLIVKSQLNRIEIVTRPGTLQCSTTELDLKCTWTPRREGSSTPPSPKLTSRPSETLSTSSTLRTSTSWVHPTAGSMTNTSTASMSYPVKSLRKCKPIIFLVIKMLLQGGSYVSGYKSPIFKRKFFYLRWPNFLCFPVANPVLTGGPTEHQMKDIHTIDILWHN